MTKKNDKKAKVSGKTGNFYDNSLAMYLKELRSIPMLSKEEEEEAARQMKNGDKAARDKLVNANLRFVISIAKKYQGSGFPLQDLISEGNIGLMNALNHYDPDKGCRLITYAVWWIRQAIVKAMQDKGRMIRLPNGKSASLSRIQETRQAMQNEPGWNPSSEIQDAAAFLDISHEKAAKLLSVGQEVVSLDEPISNMENAATLKDKLEDRLHQSPYDYAMQSVLEDEIENILGELETRSADVLRCRFGLDSGGAAMTLKEVGERYSLTRERVRQIENRALCQIRRLPRCGRLETYIAR